MDQIEVSLLIVSVKMQPNFLKFPLTPQGRKLEEFLKRYSLDSLSAHS